MARPYDFVLFDLGGVLVDVSIARAVEAWREQTSATCGLVEAVITSGAKASADRGEVNEDGMRHLVEVASGLSLSREDFRAIWGAVVSWRPFVPGLLKRINVPFGVLSNIDPVHAAVLGPLAGASPCIYSFDIRAMKPEPAAFERAAAQLSVPATRVLYLDDRTENVAAASAHGFCARETRSGADVEQALAPVLSAAGH